jgi:aspartyl-tRNA(Asn)/glutamyl-tRNA(Gln) amidotransferase subunit A
MTNPASAVTPAGADAFSSIAGVAERLRTKAISPVELTAAALERIESRNPHLHAFITVTADRALAQARAAEREIAAGRWRGPLHGIPYSLKDVYETRGIRTTAHSRVLEHWVPERDATCVTRMDEAGAVLLGKTATQEFSTGAVTEGPWPAARNPWNLDYTPSGSSSGAGAAVAAGLGFAALGGDTGASIRMPAAANGLVGIRPTYGRVSRHGVIPLSWSLDACGPLTRTVRDCALVLQAIAGYDPRDPGSANVDVPSFDAPLGTPIAGLRVGVDRKNFFHELVDPQVRAAVEEAIRVLERLGARVREIELPWLEYAHAAQNLIHMSESHAYHERRIKTEPHLYGPSLRAYLRLGAFVSAADYVDAQRVRSKIRSGMLAAFSEVDVVVAPTGARFGERFDEIDTSKRFSAGIGSKGNLAVPFSQAGVPAISVPCGFAAEGLPIGLQIAGRPFGEATVFQVAHAYEAATPWHDMHPSTHLETTP